MSDGVTRIFVHGQYLFGEAKSLLRAKLKENCELLGRENVNGQISEHVFMF